MSIVVLATLVWQVIDFLRELTNWRTNKSAVITQASAWVGGVLIMLIGAHAAVTQHLTFPGMDRPLGSLDGASIILAGLLASSLASSLVDVKQALDTTDSAVKPALLPSSSGSPGAPGGI